MILAYFRDASRESSSDFAPVTTILPDANIRAVVLGSRIRITTAAKRCESAEARAKRGVRMIGKENESLSGAKRLRMERGEESLSGVKRLGCSEHTGDGMDRVGRVEGE